MTYLAKHMRAARRKAKLTLRELASRSDLSPAYLSDVENARRTFSPDALRRVCAELRIDYGLAVKRVLADVAARYEERYGEDV